MRNLIVAFFVCLLSVSKVVADIDISKYALGMSSKTLHSQLVEDGFYFSYFDPEKITAAKYAFVGRIPDEYGNCLLYTSPSPRDTERSRMPSSA